MQSETKMTSSRPYLLRAIYEWIIDNNMTPYLLVDATAEAVQVPTQHISNGKILLNISPTAVMGLELGKEAVNFSARFGGKPMFINVPIKAVLAIYSKENGHGMVFSEESDDGSPGPGGGPGPGAQKAPRQPTLRVVK